MSASRNRTRSDEGLSPSRDAPDGGPDGSQSVRDRILHAALALFYERGYHGTSLNAIAAEVGISAPALYWHFASKKDLCFAAVHEELSRFVYALRPSRDEATPEARLGQYVRTYVLLKLKQSQWLRTPGAVGPYGQVRDALSEKQRAQLDGLQSEALDLLRATLEEGRRERVFAFEDTTATAFAIVTMCEYVFQWFRPGGRLAAPAVADLYRDLVLAMVHGSVTH
jgi:AcrR family transcriptional regulator